MPSPGFLQAQQLYMQGRLPQAASILASATKQNPGDADALQLLGVIQFQMGRAAEGQQLVERALTLDPGNADAWNSLGLMRHLGGDNEAALEAFGQATTAAPQHGEAWMNRAFIHQVLKEHSQAIEFLRRALEVGYDNPQIHLFLGNAYAFLGTHQQAVEEFDKAVAMASDFADAWHNRGNSLLALGRAEEAVASIQKALRLAPGNPLADVNLASALRALGRRDEALAILRKVSVPEAATVRADILVEQDRFEEATESLKSGLDLNPDLADARTSLARVYQHQGYWREALDLTSASTDPSHQVLRAVTLPVILDSADMVAEARGHLAESAAKVKGSGLRILNPLEEVGQTTFYLAYHGIGERELQRQVGDMYSEVCPVLSFRAGHTPGKGGRIRLGLLSAYLHGHTIGKLFGSIVERLDRERFEVVFFQLGKVDELSERIARSVDKHVVLPRSFQDSLEQVAREELDVLLYPDIGMNPHSYYMAYTRLAPVQCVMWGHPMTTGSPEMDYFISSEHLERPDGEVEYTEQLVRLPSLTTYFHRPPPPPPVTREEFGLPLDARLYTCPQTLFKFHPDFDGVLASILEGDEKGLLVLIAPKARHWQDLLVARWNRTHPIVAQRTVFLPQMKLDRFLGLAALSDAVLDPIQFGGGNSSLECFSAAAPVVTLPQGLLRNRITYGAYKEIGFEELIARDEEDYVDLAHRLANDPAWQKEMRRQVLECSTPLFENTKAVQELEGLLSSFNR